VGSASKGNPFLREHCDIWPPLTRLAALTGLVESPRPAGSDGAAIFLTPPRPEDGVAMSISFRSRSRLC
jgi:hypothetical protein